MKIIHVISGLKDGGAEAVLHRLLECTPECDHHVVSLSGLGKYGSLLRTLDVPVTDLGMRAATLSVPAAVLRLRLLLSSIGPDLVQTWMYHADLIGGLAARLAGIRPVIWGLHNSSVSPMQNPPSRQRIIRTNAMLSRLVPARIISCSKAALEAHASIGYARQKLVFIPNGHPIDRFCPDPLARRELRDEFSIANDILLLGMVARLDKQKDHSNLLKALQSLRPQLAFRCLLVGQGVGPDSALRDEIAARGLSDVIELVGPRTDIPKVMNALDIHILSSFSEAFPNVLCEAMACGTLCVTTDVGDSAVIVGETGWVVHPSAPEELAKAILMAAASGAGNPERKAAARTRIVENFSVNHMRNAYLDLWHREGRR